MFDWHCDYSAEFDISETLKTRAQVEFQILSRQDEAFVPYAAAQGRANAAGRATAKVLLNKDQAGSEVYRIPVGRVQALMAQGASVEDCLTDDTSVFGALDGVDRRGRASADLRSISCVPRSGHGQAALRFASASISPPSR